MDKPDTKNHDPYAHDPMNAPMHYREHPSGIECIVITEHMSFLRGNAVKYLWRAGSKGDEHQHLEDLKKARWYVDREIANLEAELRTSQSPDEPTDVSTVVGSMTRSGMGGALGAAGAEILRTFAPLGEDVKPWDGYPPNREISRAYVLGHVGGSTHTMTWLPSRTVWQEGFGFDMRRLTPADAAKGGYILLSEVA